MQNTGSSGEENDKKKSGNDRSNIKKKRHYNNGKGDKEKPFFCLLHGRNITHTNQCCMLQQDAEKRKKEHKKNGGKSQRANKQEIHTIVDFTKQAMELAKTANKKEGEELNYFDDLSISTTNMSS